MKIAYVINNLSKAGAESQVINIVENLNKNVEVHIILLNKIRSQENLERLEHVKCFVLTKQSRFSLKILISMLLILRKNKYDIIHANLFPSFYYIAFLKCFINSKIIYTEHSIKNNRMNFKVFKLLDNYFLNKYDAITCVSEATIRNIIKSYDIKTDIKVINNGIDTTKFQPAKIRDENKSIVMVSRFTEAKDHLTLVKAFEQLDVSQKRLILVGDGNNYKRVYDYVLINKIDNIIFLKERNDIAKILNTSYVYVQSSKWESFGIAAVEAMASGLPVVYSDVPGLKDIIKNKDLSFNVGDFEKLSQILYQLYTDSDFWEKNSKVSLVRSSAFSITRTNEQLMSLYKELLKGQTIL